MTLRLPPATATGSYSVAMTALAQQQPPRVALHLLAAPEMPADLGQLAGPLDSRIEMELKGPHLLMKATATGDLKLVCHRCLELFPYRADLQIAEHLVVQPDESSEEELEWEMADVAETIAPDGSIDLVDWLRQHVILNLPIKQLCDEACAPAPVVAAQAVQGDPRWGALRRLTSDQGDDHGTT